MAVCHQSSTDYSCNLVKHTVPTAGSVPSTTDQTLDARPDPAASSAADVCPAEPPTSQAYTAELRAAEASSSGAALLIQPSTPDRSAEFPPVAAPSDEELPAGELTPAEPDSVERHDTFSVVEPPSPSRHSTEPAGVQSSASALTDSAPDHAPELIAAEASSSDPALDVEICIAEPSTTVPVSTGQREAGHFAAVKPGSESVSGDTELSPKQSFLTESARADANLTDCDLQDSSEAVTAELPDTDAYSTHGSESFTAECPSTPAGTAESLGKPTVCEEDEKEEAGTTSESADMDRYVLKIVSHRELCMT